MKFLGDLKKKKKASAWIRGKEWLLVWCMYEAFQNVLPNMTLNIEKHLQKISSSQLFGMDFRLVEWARMHRREEAKFAWKETGHCSSRDTNLKKSDHFSFQSFKNDIQKKAVYLVKGLLLNS